MSSSVFPASPPLAASAQPSSSAGNHRVAAHTRSASGSAAQQKHSQPPRRRNPTLSDSPSHQLAQEPLHLEQPPRLDLSVAAATLASPIDAQDLWHDMASSQGRMGPLRSWCERNKGLLYVLLAQLFGVLMNVTTRLLEIEGNKGEGMHPFQILFVRMIITTILCTAYMWWTSVPHFPLGLPEVRWLLIARGIGGFFGVFGMYYSLLFLPLADATVITFITPSLSCYVCAKLIAEPFTRMEQIGALISFVGVTLISRPTSLFHFGTTQPPSAVGEKVARADPIVTPHKIGVADLTTVTAGERMTAIMIALLGVVGSAMAFVSMRWIGKRASPLLSVNYFCVCVTIVSGMAMLVLPDVQFLLPATAREWIYLIFLGCCGFAMQFLLSAGLQHEKSSRATLMTYTQMIFALFFDKLIFGHNPALTSIFGSLLIVGSAIYIALQKESAKQRADAEKQREQELAVSGTRVEMREGPGLGHSDEEQALVEGMDPVDEVVVAADSSDLEARRVKDAR